MPSPAPGAGRAWGAGRRTACPPIRSLERRRWSADLLGAEPAGLVVHGVGGIGKSTLAAEIVARISRAEPERMTKVLSGEVSADGFLAGLAGALRRHPLAPVWGGLRAQAVAAAGRIDLPWEHRMSLLREHVLGQVPVLIALDDFDDNLSGGPGGPTVRDPALASLLGDWVRQPQLGRLLITARRTFTLPVPSGQGLGFRHLGPLSRSAAATLAGSLPALRLLSEADLDHVWRLLGGHPRAMEYLDALLRAGHIDFPDVARRLAAAIQAATGQPAARAGLDPPTGLPPAVAETVALTAADVLLHDLCGLLSAAAHGLLTGASVYRAPIAASAALLPPAQRGQAGELAGLIAECEATGLLAADRGREPPTVFVHRWTASELHRRLAEAGRGEEVTDAHRRAGGYWRRRITVSPQDRHALFEASYHLLLAGEQAGSDQPEPRRVVIAARRWRLRSLATVAVIVLILLTAQATGIFLARQLASTPLVAAATRAAAVRAQAAVWAARQVSRDAIVACDPAMCAALRARGIAGAKLLVLRPATPDPLGSDVVMATAAVRSQFGPRLVSVYAPGVLASFGSGGMRIDVRAVAPDGGAAYVTALASDVAARRQAGNQLLRNPRIVVTAAARRALAGGRVDSRLLITLAAVAAAWPVNLTAFTDAGPGASLGMPLRAAEVAVAAHAGDGAAILRRILAFVRAQRPPYLPARARIARGAAGLPVLTIEFAAPTQLGLLRTQPGGPARERPAKGHRTHTRGLRRARSPNRGG